MPSKGEKNWRRRSETSPRRCQQANLDKHVAGAFHQCKGRSGASSTTAVTSSVIVHVIDMDAVIG